MASLNLVPNPVVLGVQAGIFLANLLVVKKLLLEPFLRVREKRAKATLGTKADAVGILAQCESARQEIHQRLAVAAEAVKTSREQIRAAAASERAKILAAAAEQSKGYVYAMANQIKQELAHERAKVPGVVARLTDELYRLALD